MSHRAFTYVAVISSAIAVASGGVIGFRLISSSTSSRAASASSSTASEQVLDSSGFHGTRDWSDRECRYATGPFGSQVDASVAVGVPCGLRYEIAGDPSLAQRFEATLKFEMVSASSRTRTPICLRLGSERDEVERGWQLAACHDGRSLFRVLTWDTAGRRWLPIGERKQKATPTRSIGIRRKSAQLEFLVDGSPRLTARFDPGPPAPGPGWARVSVDPGSVARVRRLSVSRVP